MAKATSFSERYHEATKYSPESLRRASAVDPREQPSPFKDWHQGVRLALPRSPSSEGRASPGPVTAERLGRLLFHTYGVTRVQEIPGATVHFRAAPSAGALYPTEVYVAVRGVPGVPDGVHDYQARDHHLALCWEGDFWGELSAASFGHPAVAAARAVLLLTGVFERSAWRYRDRAYRRVLLDAGHVMGNAVLAAGADGLAVVPIADFSDEAVEGMLLLDRRAEGPLLLGAVVPADARGVTRAPGGSGLAADVESPGEEEWIPAIHDVARMSEARRHYVSQYGVEKGGGDERGAGEPATTPVGQAADATKLDDEPLPAGEPVLEAIRRRRSTRHFQVGTVPRRAVGRILAHAYPAPGSGEPEARIVPDLLQTWVVVADVEGLPAGVHAYDPVVHGLRPVRRGNPRRALFESCLLQELGRDAAFTVVHSFDLPRAVTRYGERAYRYAHLEAGLIGERLDLAALRLGLGASGIAGFFDEMLADLLLLPKGHAVAYLTTIGIPA